MKLKKIYIEKFKPLVFYCNKYLDDIDESKDVAQECFVSLYKNYAEISDAENYLFTIARNKCLNVLRHNRAKNKYSEETIFLAKYDLDIEKRNIDLVGKIVKQIEKLSPKQQQVIKLSLGGATYQEIAELLNISAESVKTHKKRAYLAIRDSLKDDFYLLFVVFC